MKYVYINIQDQRIYRLSSGKVAHAELLMSELSNHACNAAHNRYIFPFTILPMYYSVGWAGRSALKTLEYIMMQKVCARD